MRKKRLRFFPYKAGSRSAKALAQSTNGKVLRHANSVYKPRLGDLVVNWGSANFPEFAPATTLNANIADVSCKLTSFKKFADAGVKAPSFWTAKEEIPEDAFPIVCRTILRGHSGNGIVMANNPEELVPAPLYVQYKKKKEEYRVHVFQGDPFFVQRKAKKNDVEDPNWQVRNLEGGFVFVVSEDTPQKVLDEAVKASEALGVDFGGVDVIWNEHEGEAYVLEINTACGLEERTAEHYAAKIRDCFEN